jgi:adenylate cyclase
LACKYNPFCLLGALFTMYNKMGLSELTRHKSFISFLSELKERKVLRVAVAYIVVTWIVIQVGESTFEALNLPSWANSLLVVFIMLGFPFAMLLAWAYELTPDGIIKDSEDDVAYRIGSQQIPDSVRALIDKPMLPSIAVLQFEDMSPEQDQTYFCQGIAEEILCALDEVNDLNVAARLASFQFSSKSADILEIGRKLNVSVVLEGSVRKAGDHIRITIQLINAHTGYQFWTGQYNHELKDIFEIQEQMAQAVVSAMRLSIGDNKLTRSMTKNTEAYDAFLKAKSYLTHPDKQSILYARKFYQRAVELDPDFGRAWAKLATTYVYEHLCGDPHGSALAEAERISNMALQVAPDIAESHIARGLTCSLHSDYAQADLEFETAINLYPASFNAWFSWARCKAFQGDTRKAVEFYQKASEIRPHDYQSVLIQVRFLEELGDSDGAEEKAKEGLEKAKAALEVSPDEYHAWNMGAFALHKLGQLTEAKKWMETSMQNSPHNSILTYNAASFYAMIGDIEKSLDYLTRAADSGCLNLGWLEQDSGLVRVREDPRYEQLLTKFKGECFCGCANPACL